MGSSGLFIRSSVVHDEDVTSILKGAKVMIGSIGSNYHNGKFGFVGGVDAVKSLLGK